MSTKGQTINDRLNAAKYTLAGQALARSVCKATTEEWMKPKKKHLDYLVACTYESNVSIQQLANMIIERTNHSDWAVVYKALITIHHLMCFGNERFIQYLASSNYSFQSTAVPDTSIMLERISAKRCSLSSLMKRYSNYINQKGLSYRTLAVDLCRTQKGEKNLLRSMPIERLLGTLPVIQKQLDCLLDFDCTENDFHCRDFSIITACYTLLFHDCIRLFANYNDGIINLFEKYFDLNKKMCREAFEAYKKFLACTDRVANFLKLAKAINLDCGEVPDFKRAPNSLLDALEQHLTSLENNKKRTSDKVVIDTKSAAFPSFTPPTQTEDSFSELFGAIAQKAELYFESSSPPHPSPPSPQPAPAAVLPVVVPMPTPSPTPPPAAPSIPPQVSTSIAPDFDSLLSFPTEAESEFDKFLASSNNKPIAITEVIMKPNQPPPAPVVKTNRNNNNSPQPSARTKQEHMFEDLEKTMRQSLKTGEKA